MSDADYDNGEFTLKLPESVGNKYLKPFFADEDDIPDELTISNLDAKIGATYLLASESNEFAGLFYYATGTYSSAWIGGLVYVNSDLSVTGSFIGEIYTFDDDGNIIDINGDCPLTYNVNVKKGWNIVYEKTTEDEYEMTTIAPSGLKWYFEAYSSSSSSSSSVAAVKSSKGAGAKKTLPSLFSKLKNNTIIKEK